MGVLCAVCMLHGCDLVVLEQLACMGQSTHTNACERGVHACPEACLSVGFGCVHVVVMSEGCVYCVHAAWVLSGCV